MLQNKLQEGCHLFILMWCGIPDIDLYHHWNVVAYFWSSESCFYTKKQNDTNQSESFLAVANICNFRKRPEERWLEGLLIIGSILPRELISHGVLESKISSSTIWNRCSWVGKDFYNHSPSTVICARSIYFHHLYSWIYECNSLIIILLSVCFSELFSDAKRRCWLSPFSFRSEPPSYQGWPFSSGV